MIAPINFSIKSFRYKIFAPFFTLMLLSSLTSNVSAVFLPQSHFEWRKTIDYGKGNYALQTLDGYIITGTTDEYNDDWQLITMMKTSAMLMKTNSRGHLQWTKTYHASSTASGNYNSSTNTLVVNVPNFDCNFTVNNFCGDSNQRDVTGVQVVESYGSVVFQTEDGGFILIGFETWTVEIGTSSKGKYDVLFLIKTNRNGVPLWKKAYVPFPLFLENNHIIERSVDAIQTKDGGFVIVGLNWANCLGIVKVDSMCDLQWETTINVDNYEFSTDDEGCFSLTEESNGDILLGGKCGCPQVLTVDSYGNLKRTLAFQNELKPSFHDFIKTNDDSYLWIGMTEVQDNQHVAYAFKADSQGNVVWNKTFPLITCFERAIETSDGNYIFVGYELESGIHLVQVNPLGDFQWDKSLNHSHDRINHVFFTSDNALLFVGNFVEEIIVNSWSPVYEKYWILLSKVTTYTENSEFPTRLGKISLLSPENRTYTQQNLTISYDFEGHAPWVGYSLDSQPPVTINKQTPLTLPVGTHDLTLFATDLHDTTGSSETVQFTIAKILEHIEVVSLLAPQNQTYSSSSISLTYAVKDPVSWVSYSLDSQQPVLLTTNTTLKDLTKGEHNISLLVKLSNGTTLSSEPLFFNIVPPFLSDTTLGIIVALVAIILSAVVVILLKKRNSNKMNPTQP